jgi:hypothetical protein
MRKVLLSSLLLLVSPTAAFNLLAGDATIFTGFQKAGKLTLSNTIPTVTGAITSDTDWGGVVGARFSGGKVIGFEQSIGYSPKFLKSDLHAFNTQSNLILNIPVPHITPYATAGIGLVSTWGSSILTFGTKFTVNYGGGIKLNRLAGPIGIRFDLRGYTIPNVLFEEANSVCNNCLVKQNLNFIEGTVGILFSW